MASLNNANVKIQVLIDKEVNGLRYNDAMYFSAAEYAALTNQQVIDMAQVRFDAWKVKMQAASQRRPTKAEWQAVKLENERRALEIEAEITAALEE